ncbi:hypothetical protein ACNOYE_32230 [Nannocystaceae bacterium ST9]
MRASITLIPVLCLQAAPGCAGESHDATNEVDTALHEPEVDPNLISMAATGPRTPEEQADLDQLAALAVFEVGPMLARYPAGAFNCYGVCPGLEDEIAEANEAAGERLAALAELAGAALEAEPASEPEVCEQATIDANLAALRALEIVEVGEFLALAPRNNPNCYNLPCAEDIEDAAAKTCERATTLARIVDGL